jgi:O-methyltransferase
MSIFDNLLVPLLTLIILSALFILMLKFFYYGNIPVIWTNATKNGKVSRKLKKLRNRYPDKLRFYIFWLQNERLKADKIPGAFAEVGVYRGDSAAILHALDPERELHLFDTFTGFPASDLEGETGEAATYTTDHFADVDVENILKRFDDNDKIHIHKGCFPETTVGLEERRFAMVNLDADLYKPTKASLEFFYPRLSPGGVILIHDYNDKWPGIMKAVNEFVVNIPETIVLMPDTDVTVVIVKNN